MANPGFNDEAGTMEAGVDFTGTQTGFGTIFRIEDGGYHILEAPATTIFGTAFGRTTPCTGSFPSTPCR